MREPDPFAIWIELTGSDQDGKVIMVEGRHRYEGVRFAKPPPPYRYTDPMPKTGPSFDIVKLVPTGSVRWHLQVPVEVWVPEDRLDYWRAEYDVANTSP